MFAAGVTLVVTAKRMSCNANRSDPAANLNPAELTISSSAPDERMVATANGNGVQSYTLPTRRRGSRGRLRYVMNRLRELYDP